MSKSMPNTAKPTFQIPGFTREPSLQDVLQECINRADNARALATLFVDLAIAADGTGKNTVTLDADGLAEFIGRLAADFDFVGNLARQNWDAILCGTRQAEVA